MCTVCACSCFCHSKLVTVSFLICNLYFVIISTLLLQFAFFWYFNVMVSMPIHLLTCCCSKTAVNCTQYLILLYNDRKRTISTYSHMASLRCGRLSSLVTVCDDRNHNRIWSEWRVLKKNGRDILEEWITTTAQSRYFMSNFY